MKKITDFIICKQELILIG